MVSDASLRSTIDSAVRVIDNHIPGVMVECGVWKGGASLAMLLAQTSAYGNVFRKVHMLDGFSGMPNATLQDGPAAIAWQSKTTDNCRATFEELQDAIRQFGFVGDAVVWRGPFQETLPHAVEAIDQIALLRLDCDWYHSMAPCLEELMPKVPEGGIVLIDDYYAWDGCARAVHEYLSRHDRPLRIRSIEENGVPHSAYFVV